MTATVSDFYYGAVTPVAAYLMACLGAALGLRCTTRSLRRPQHRARWLALGAVAITDTDGKAVREEGCPSCKQGVLILRPGPYGEFRSCSNFPVCRYKPNKRGEGQIIRHVEARADPVAAGRR